MVKNVALVDDELQGKQWTSNKGGSGFGKFGELPNPKVISWQSNKDFDLFVGSHDGFENVGVEYHRQVVFVKDDFWIVKDNFSSDQGHEYKQVWQGHYTNESGPNLIRATFADASGVDILQLIPIDTAFSSGTRGKNWTVISKTNQKDFSFVTVVFPYRGYHNRIDELTNKIRLENWVVNDTQWELFGDHPISISNEDEGYFFGVQELRMPNLNIEISSVTDLYLKHQKDKIRIHLLGKQKRTVTVRREKVKNRNELTKELTPMDYLELEYFP